MAVLFRQFSFPGGVPSHCAPETPGSFNEGGELGYSLLHAYGAALDHPDLLVLCVVGDGEAETGALATSWHCNKFINPARDGAVLPVLHLNQYKIANPTLLARISEEELLNLLRGYGYAPHIVSGDDPASVHQAMAGTLETCVKQIGEIHHRARADGDESRPAWPMIVLRTPKGWTCPPVVNGQRVEGTFRAHQVPLPGARTNDEHRQALEQWLRAYRPEELFDDAGRPVPELLALAPAGNRRMSANPVANGGLLLRDLRLPGWQAYGVAVEKHGAEQHEATRVLGGWLRDVTRLNPANFLTFAPDELVSNRLGDILEVTGRNWQAQIGEYDDRLDRHGRAIEVLSEHICQGLLEGYLLSGRHGVFTCYEAFIHIVDSMFNQHAKWLEASTQVLWRRPLASLNYLLSSHVWRQDHNGFTHQDPGFLDVVLNKSPAVVRVYLPPDTNTLLSTYDHCLRSRHYVNVVVAGKQPQADWLSVDDAALHCARGAGIWEWASSDSAPDTVPDVVLACAGDVPTLETLAATSILRAELPGPAGQGGQHRRSHASAARVGSSARAARPRIRHAVHRGQARHLRLPRLPVACAPAHLPAAQSRPHARPRLQGEGDHDDAVRHGDAQRPRPLPPGHGRHRPGARPGASRGQPATAHGRLPAAGPGLDSSVRRGHTRGRAMDLARVKPAS